MLAAKNEICKHKAEVAKRYVNSAQQVANLIFMSLMREQARLRIERLEGKKPSINLPTFPAKSEVGRLATPQLISKLNFALNEINTEFRLIRDDGGVKVEYFDTKPRSQESEIEHYALFPFFDVCYTDLQVAADSNIPEDVEEKSRQLLEAWETLWFFSPEQKNIIIPKSSMLGKMVKSSPNKIKKWAKDAGWKFSTSIGKYYLT